MRKLYHISLEPYIARYTYQLKTWYEAEFKQRDVNYVFVEGDTLDNSKAIVTGQVLDAHGRSYYSMTQLARLVKMMKDGEITSEDVILFEDMFTPGIESLPYIMDQTPKENRPKVFVRCLAQSIDPDDFVHVCGMEKWMGYYEKMVDSFVDGVLATNEEMVAHMKIAGWTAPIYNISGLAFGKDEVRSRVTGELKPFNERTMRVSFAARTDQEKQPDFYLDLIDEWHRRHPTKKVEFCFLSGGKLKGNDTVSMDRIHQYAAMGKVTIHENLEKNQYYALLNDSRVLFNCALQDWWSNTVNEADVLGCNVLYPAYRSFPETLANDPDRLYVPWSLDDAINKLEKLLKNPHKNMGKVSDWADGTIGRTLDILEGNGEQWLRMDKRYRNHTRVAKF